MRDLFTTESTTVGPPADGKAVNPACMTRYTPEMLNRLASDAAALGYAIVDIAGFVDQIDQNASGQRPILDEARRGAQRIHSANSQVQDAIGIITSATEENLRAVEQSFEIVHNSGSRTKSVAEWVQALDTRMSEVSSTLKEVQKNNGAITSIAAQVNILAINAKIEAARAGDAGRGFAVVAEAVNELSRKTGTAAERILASVQQLSGWIESLRGEAETVAREAGTVLSDSQETDRALGSIAENVRATHDKACAIGTEASAVDRAAAEFGVCFDRIDAAVTDTSGRIHEAREKVNGLIDRSESLVQQSVALGGGGSDAALIDFVQSQAKRVGDLFSTALAEGTISQQALFDFTYTPIPNTDPQQFRTPFLDICDRLLPPVLEGALEADPKVIFCAAVTQDGFLPTHNRKFSQPQRAGDPAWNGANARNRRMFNDRVGLKAGRNTEPFLMQVYRRDMGGGTFKMMKDVSAPILVDGRHWGGLRMGVSF